MNIHSLNYSWDGKRTTNIRGVIRGLEDEEDKNAVARQRRRHQLATGMRPLKDGEDFAISGYFGLERGIWEVIFVWSFVLEVERQYWGST